MKFFVALGACSPSPHIILRELELSFEQVVEGSISQAARRGASHGQGGVGG